MRRRIVFLSAILAIGSTAALIGGCKAPPTKEEKSAVDYGSKPENYEQIIREYMKTRVKDGVIFEFRAGPKPLYQQDTVLRPLQYGWGTCVFVHDKRASVFESYPMVFFIRNGVIVGANGGPEDSVIGRRFALAGCNELGSPFVTR
jgi:hypothetical protein